MRRETCQREPLKLKEHLLNVSLKFLDKTNVPQKIFVNV